MPPTGAPVKTPTYEDELLLLEAARLIAGTYEGNPRNYEDVWYLFWLQFFKIWTLHIFCLCMPSAQYSVYTKWAADVHNILAQVDFSNLTSASDWTEHIGMSYPPIPQVLHANCHNRFGHSQRRSRSRLGWSCAGRTLESGRPSTPSTFREGMLSCPTPCLNSIFAGREREVRTSG